MDRTADLSGGPIGLIADSHGNLEATQEAIHLLLRNGASALFHLGDFCDSVRHDRTAAMIGLLRDHNVQAVKGNNDFLIETLLADARPSSGEEAQLLGFLRGVPITRAFDGLCFAHSLPEESCRAFYEPIDRGNTERAARLFAETTFHILFCGHSHLPVLFRKAGERVTREPVPAGEKVVLRREERYILIVGAAESGECALFHREAGTYERLRIPDR